MNPQTTADVVAAVEKAFKPDITIRRIKGRQRFHEEHFSAYPAFKQICREAYEHAKKELHAAHDEGRPFYAVSAIGLKLWDGKIDDTTLDYFLSGAGHLGLCVAVVDENNP